MKKYFCSDDRPSEDQEDESTSFRKNPDIYDYNPWLKKTSILIGNNPKPWMRAFCNACGKHHALCEIGFDDDKPKPYCIGLLFPEFYDLGPKKPPFEKPSFEKLFPDSDVRLFDHKPIKDR